jgi:RND family efflux transporter MFP subunit
MKKILKALLPIVALGLGIAVMVGFIATKPKAEKAARVDLGALVEAQSVERSRRLVKVKTHGTVVPSRQVIISPEVNGRVVWMNPELVPGGRFAKGEKIVRVDARDYSLAADQQYAMVDQASTALQVEKGRKKIAVRECELMGGEAACKKGSLALRDPQMRTAEVALKSAESGLKRARLNVGRALLKAPFNALVQARAVDIGQLVGPASPLVTLVGTDSFWVQLSIPVDRLAWIDIPGIRGAKKGSRALVYREIGNERIERTGEVIRLLGDLDPLGRMARVLVEIKDPLGLDSKAKTAVGEGQPEASPGLPLLIGAFVQVEIDGREIDGVVEVPREALRNGDTVYVIANERIALPPALSDVLFWADPADVPSLLTLQTMAIREVNVVWRKPDSVLVNEGLESGDQIIVSPVPSAIEGMKVRTLDILGEAPASDKQAAVVP